MQPQDPNKLYAIIYDGTDIELKFRDKREPEVRKVRKVPVFEMGKFGLVFGKELKEVAFYLDLPQDKVPELTDETFEAVIEEGRRLNFISFEKWWKRQGPVLNLMGDNEQTEALLEKVSNKIAEQAMQ